jgi:hypothetical protein
MLTFLTACHPALRSEWFKRAYGQEKQAEVEKIFKEEFKMYQTKVNQDLPSTVTMDKPDFSQRSSSSLLNSLFEDVPEDDETPSGPVKDELDRYFKEKEGPECAIDASLPWWKVCHCPSFRKFF